jgi:oxygen-independent coproporphyrinogen-3 oxidase
VSTLRERLRAGPYQAYAYAYPHKSAYRALPAPVDLGSLWAGEDRSALFAYIHIPFCSYRCGFCNLFAIGRPDPEVVERYVGQLVSQISSVGALLGRHRFARLALGGGTPGYLSPAQLSRVLETVTRSFTIDLQRVPACIEVSPETVTEERLTLCRQAGIDRVSMGVQSFSDAELRALARPVQGRAVLDAIDRIRALGFPTLNLDLIYGIRGQTVASFERSLASALGFRPEELYLYPLYVRPETGLGKRLPDSRSGSDTLQLYRAGRERLLEAGYRQMSMRMFRAPWAPPESGPAYRCQDDGMVGVGCGARSYTRALHYSDPYGVARASVSQILQQYIEASVAALIQARYGFALELDEQRRRHVIQSLLTWPGLDEAAYAARFGTRPFEDLPQLSDLLEEGLANRVEGVLTLTPEGMAHADVIGPWLTSPAVQARMQSCAA